MKLRTELRPLAPFVGPLVGMWIASAALILTHLV